MSLALGRINLAIFKFQYLYCPKDLNMRAIFGLILMLSCCLSSAYAQFTDAFADDNFTQSPPWVGQPENWIVTPTFQLQSNGPNVTSTIYLGTPSESYINTQWEFFANPRCATSSNNLIDVFVMADLVDFTSDNCNGYFIRIGGTPDEVAFFKKTGATETKLIEGLQGSIGSSSNNPTKVKLTRDDDGYFQLYADYSGVGNQYSLVGAITDGSFTDANWFGLRVKYSASNFNRYNFDDFYVGPIQVDNVPPQADLAKPINANQILIRFSEVVSQASAESTDSYVINNGIGEPLAATRDVNNPNEVLLTLQNPLAQAESYLITISGIRDLSNNAIIATQLPFTFYQAKPYDVVFNEIMPDPSPVVGLPDVEYFELYNRSSFPIEITGWTIRTGDTDREIPEYILQAGEYAVCMNVNNTGLFPDTIPIIGITSFSALTNSGQTLSLISTNDESIHSISYSDSWYQNTVKKDGGWSLEQIDQNNPCAGASNWIASNNPSGGTPGRTNSVNAQNPDNSSPTLIRVNVITSDTIQVVFNETIPLSLQTNIESYIVDNGIGNPIQVITEPPNYQRVKLALANPLVLGQVYTINIASTIQDCVGNSFENNTSVKFAIPFPPQPGDIVINELLSNPATGCFDFVELYNRSENVIDLKFMLLGNYDVTLDAPTNTRTITTDGYLLFPKEYVVLSADAEAVKNCYFTSNPNAFLSMSPFPTLNNDDGSVSLIRSTTNAFIDKFEYNTSLHFALLADRKGITLERVNPDKPSSDATNWNSAASEVGFGTPGYRNSQFTPLGEANQGKITITPEAFSPDGDGFDDIAAINYSLEESGFSGSFYIYDANGRLIKTVAKAVLLGTEGTYFWNGISDTNEKAKVGIYVAVLDAFKPDGKVVQLRKALVVVARL